MNVSRALAEGRARLREAGIDTPFLDASLLLAHALGTSRERILVEGGQAPPLSGRRKRSALSWHSPPPVPPSAALERYETFLARRAAGESIAYITGIKEFWGMDFAINPAVLVPRPDTEILVETALAFIATFRRPEAACPALPVRLLDLCTGSGAVAIALKHEQPGLEVWAADISPEALETARLNAARLLGKAPGGAPETVHFCRGDLFAALAAGNGVSDGRAAPRFSLVTANAPYVPSAAIAALAPEVRGEPRIALDGGGDGLCLIRRIIASAPDYLEGGGALILEADPSQMDPVAGLLEARGFTGIHRHNDLAGRGRVICGNVPA